MTHATEDHRLYVEVGRVYRARLTYSEVCCSMKVAGQDMYAVLLDSTWSVQLLDDSGRLFSSPITRGEAGVYEGDDGRFYVRTPCDFGYCGADATQWARRPGETRPICDKHADFLAAIDVAMYAIGGAS